MKVIIGLLVFLCLILGYFIYTQIPGPTYKFRSPPKLLTPIVSVGGIVKWQNDICRLQNHPFYSQKTFINLSTGRHYPIPDLATKATLKAGECQVIDVSQMVPTDIPSGMYDLLTEVFVKSNPWNTDTFQYTIGPFTIK